ncbi:hypothetical protein ACQ86N_02890 [Puia sp. P3]|uniref:hypothetical protein n=1 Tax=Puia sp. P3 TaxID=3423952 RepID=UPI003D672A6A
MIVYQKNKEEFSNDVLTNDIDGIITRAIKTITGKAIAASEVNAYRQSLHYMDTVLHDKDIPDDCGISIEYHIPSTSKRIDFLITGSDGNRDNLIIVELKGWSEARLTSRAGRDGRHAAAGQDEHDYTPFLSGLVVRGVASVFQCDHRRGVHLRSALCLSA